MITLEQAKLMFSEMIETSGGNYTLDFVMEAQFEEPLYVPVLIDENGEQLLPGEKLQSIEKSTGRLVDFIFPCPA